MSSGTEPVPYDQWLIALVICIIGIGLLMMTSASIDLSDERLHQPFYYLFKQLIFLSIGLMLGNIVVQIPIYQWEIWRGYLLLGALFLLAIVLIPGIGRSANGSIRWIGYSSFNFQVSTLAQLCAIIFMAGYLVRRQVEIRSALSGFIKPIVVIVLMAIFLLREPDFGSTVVLMSTILGMMFLAGMRLRYFITFGILIVLVLSIIAISAPYRLQRLTSFLDPWQHSFSSGYQLIQSLIAFGRGSWTGVGLGRSMQKMFYLPEANTDFLFAVIVEEWGVLGALLIIGCFFMLVMRCLMIGKTAQQLGQHFAGFFGLWHWFMDCHSIYCQYWGKLRIISYQRINAALDELWWQ